MKGRTQTNKMKTKYLYEPGEKLPNPKCICPSPDKSNCFKVFSIAPEHEDRFGHKTKESSYWKIECPYLNGISREAGRKANEVLSRFFSRV